MNARTRLSPVDAAWLRMDSETNPLVITTMLTLDGPVDPRALDVLVEHLASGERFRQRIVRARGVGVGSWEDDPRFDAGAHVHRVALPSPADDRALAS